MKSFYPHALEKEAALFIKKLATTYPELRAVVIRDGLRLHPNFKTLKISIRSVYRALESVKHKRLINNGGNITKAERERQLAIVATFECPGVDRGKVPAVDFFILTARHDAMRTAYRGIKKRYDELKKAVAFRDQKKIKEILTKHPI